MLVMEISLLQEGVWSSQHCAPDVRSAARRELVHTEVLPIAALMLPELPWLGAAEREARMRWDLKTVARLAEQYLFFFFLFCYFNLG